MSIQRVTCNFALNTTPVMERQKTKEEIQNNHRNIEKTDAETLKNLIEKVGLEKLNIVLEGLSNAEKISPVKGKKENKNYKNKTLIFRHIILLNRTRPIM